MSLYTGIVRATVGVALFVLTPIMASAAVHPIKATNPITSTLIPSSGIPSTTAVGSAYGVEYVLRNNLPFNELVRVITFNVHGLGFTVIDNCSGKTLAANGGTCPVHVEFQPVRTGPANLQLYMQYDKNVVPLGPLSTNVISTATGEISGKTTERLPGDTTIGTGYDVQFTYTNNSSSSITASSITFSGNTSDFTHDAGCTTALAPSHSCIITGTFTPSVAGATSIGVSYNYDAGTKSVALSTSTVASGSSTNCASVSGSGPLLLPSATYQYADNVIEFKFTNQCDAASATLGTVQWSGAFGGSSIVRKATSLVKGEKAIENLKKIKGTKNKLGDDIASWITHPAAQDNCSGQTLAPNGSCTVYASLVPQATGTDLNISASVAYTESNQAKTSKATSATDVLSNDSTNRMITIVNQCSVPVWMSFQAGAVGPSCTTTSDCPPNSTCTSGLCYWNNPSLDGNHQYGEMAAVQSNAAPDTMNVIVPESNGGTSLTGNNLYNAGIIARLGCTAPGSGNNPIVCTVNNCDGTVSVPNGTTEPDGQCTPGYGADNTPGMSYNAVEFDFQRYYGTSSGQSAVDGVYDEQTINGVNVPMEMKGRGPFTPSSVNSAPYNNCNPAGAFIQQSVKSDIQLGGCNYNYTTPTTTPGAPGTARASSYRFVLADGTSCDTSDSQCDGVAPDVCGLAYNGTTLSRQCGQLAGYVSVNTGICSQGEAEFAGGLGAELFTAYTCTSPIYTNGETGTALYGCEANPAGTPANTYATQSCYNPDPNNPPSSCCGCTNWWEDGIQVPPTGTTACSSPYINTSWASGQGGAGIVQPQIQWVKSACPTAYSYQYDDPSSQFKCTVVNSTTNTIVTNYQVTFCPGKKEVSKVLP